jgi:DNA repair protein RadA/Sms
VTVTLEGRRPLLAEVQALVARSTLATPRRAVSGLDSARVAMVLAVLERRGRVRLGADDVFSATVGGVRVTEPAADLALALAVASAARDAPIPPATVVLGEVGLSGEVRRVGAVGRRLAEAARLGFSTALVPPDPGPLPDGGSPRWPTSARRCGRCRAEPLEPPRPGRVPCTATYQPVTGGHQCCGRT